MVKVHQLVAAIATTVTLSTTGAYALNMGEISWKSSYGQPLNAEIALSDAGGLTATDIRASLATNAELTKAGIDHSSELSKLIFTTIMGKNNKAYIKVTSNSPIKEPYLNFLVNINYKGNILSKEYTILMDLPSTGSKTTIKTPTSSTSSIAKVTSPSDIPNSYKIQKGDTLWQIAKKLVGNNNTARMATAIYKNNPHAFISGNVNNLIAGYSLKIPTEQQVQSVSSQDAKALLQSAKSSNKVDAPKPNTIEKNNKLSNQLENKLKDSEQELNQARLENDELSTRLEQLQAEIDKLDEISKLKDQQLQSIQNQIAEQAQAEAKQPEPVTEPTPAVEPEPVTEPEPTTTIEPEPITEPEPTTAIEPEPVTEPEPTPAVEPEPVTRPAPTPIIEPDPEPEDNTLFFGLDTTMLTQIGGGALLLLCVVAIIIRRRKANENTIEVDLNHTMLDTLPNEKEQDSAGAVEETDATENTAFSNLDETETNIIDKADIYLAYNRYTEATNLLVDAIEKDPTNKDYYSKLIEIYAEQGDTANFKSTADQLLILDPLAQSKIDNLKAQYPDLTATTEQNISSTSEIEIPTITEQVGNTNQAFMPEDKDTNFTLDTISSHEVKETPLFKEIDGDNFNEDSPIYGFSHEESKQEEPEEKEKFEFDLGLDQNSLMQEQKPEEPEMSDWSAFVDDTYETTKPTELPDLEMTTPVMDTLATEPVIETQVPNDSDDIIEKDQVTTKLELVYAYLEMKDVEGAQDLITEILQEGNDEQKAEANKILASINNTSAPDTNNTLSSIDPEIDTTDTSKLNLGFELSQDDEVTTKIELARAYIDMGDTSGAQDILNEVLQEGNADQQKEAEQLISTLS